MAESIQDKIVRSLQTANELYYRLILLVGEAGTGKTSVLRAFASHLDIEVLNLNLALSARLLDLTPRQRALRLPKILDELIDPVESTLILDNIEILFDRALQQDPLRLLQGMSRNRSVLAAWNGRVSKGKLIYAEPGHPEYQSYEVGTTLIVAMDGRSTIDEAQTIESASEP